MNKSVILITTIFFLTTALFAQEGVLGEASDSTELILTSQVLSEHPLGEGVGENGLAALLRSIEAEGETSPTQGNNEKKNNQKTQIIFPNIITYVDAPVVEQRQVFTSEDLEKSHYSDLASVIEDAGIQVLSYGPYGLESKPSIRGFTDETVRVVIDGICMNNAQTGTFDFSTIDMSTIEKIEVVRGGFTEGVEDEGAVGGVIYITTKKQSLQKKVLFDSGVKSFFNTKTSPLTLDTVYGKAGTEIPVGKSSFFKANFCANYAQNRFLYENYLKKIVTQENACVKDGSSDIKFTHYWKSGNSFTISDMFYGADKNFPGPKTSLNIGKQKDLNNALTVDFFNPEIFNVLNAKNILAYVRTRRTYNDNSGKSSHKIDTVKYSSFVEMCDWNIVKESAGLSFECTHLNSTNSGTHNQISGVLKETTKFYFNKTFCATVPLAVKFSGSNIAFIPKTGVAATFSFLSIMLDGYRMIQFPNMDDLYWQGAGYKGNPDLKPEKGWGLDLTFDVKNIAIPFSLQFFTNYYEDKITWSANTTKNEKSAFYAGVDFAAQASFFEQMIVIKLNGEYLYNRLLDKSDTLTYGKRIMWTPDLTQSLKITLNFKKWNFTIDENYTGKRYKSNLNISYLKPYTIWNATGNIYFSDNVKFYARLENLLNTSYESVDGYAMPGLSCTLGAKFNF